MANVSMIQGVTLVKPCFALLISKSHTIFIRMSQNAGGSMMVRIFEIPAPAMFFIQSETDPASSDGH